MGDLDGRVAIVTGASRQIGAAVARALGGRGADVVVNYYSGQDRAEDVASSVRTTGSRAIICRADVTIRDEVATMVALAVATFGGVDILVNNARQVHTKRAFLETDWQEDFLSQMKVHLGGAFNTCQEAIPHMLSRGGGVIVNMLSTAFRSADARTHAYGPAKAALRNFTMNLAAEFGPRGIRVNSVSPGNTSSPGFTSRNRSPEEIDAIRMRTPLRRIATPEDVAETVAFLCSDAARHITGADIAVNGGAFIAL